MPYVPIVVAFYYIVKLAIKLRRKCAILTMQFSYCRVEFLICLGLWIFANIYCLYRLHGSLRGDVIDNYDGFVQGWSFLKLLKDDSDFEWSVWRAFLLQCYPWLCLNYLAAELCRVADSKFVPFSYISVALLFFCFKFGVIGFIILVIQPIIFWYVVTRSRNIAAVWLCSIASFTFIYSLDYLVNHSDVLLASLSVEELYLIVVTCSWMQLRCISFSYYLVEAKKNASFGQCLSYSFYLPFAVLGPIIPYEDFERSLHRLNYKNFHERIGIFVKRMLRVTIWVFSVELSLHFIYFNRLHPDMKILETLPSWALYGGGVWMGLFFYLKYLIVYGISCGFSYLDHIDPPQLPRCIMTIHLYSDMWKNFDVGLYKFLVRYIYKPCIGILDGINIPRRVKTLLGSASCFTFVYIWHGTHAFVLIWTVLNYLGIVLESLGRELAKHHIVSSTINKVFATESAKARFFALISSPLLLMSALSNFYFFGGFEFGNYYVRRVFSESIYSLIFIHVFLYSSCYVCAKISTYLRR